MEYRKQITEEKERLVRELSASCDREVAQVKQENEQIKQENEQIKRQLYEMKADTNRTRQQLQESHVQIGEYAQTVDILTESTSWRVTRPIRKIGDFLKRI